MNPDTECVIVVGSLELRCPSYPAECDYVRIVDTADGAEIGYWDNNEWARDPRDVMGAIIGQLKGGLRA